MKNFTITLSILFLSMSIQAQEISLSGKIVSNTQQPLEFVNVLLLNAVDSSLVKGNVTDVNGHYFLKNIPPDNYLLSVMMVGYQKQYIPTTIKADETNFKQKDIILLEDISNLETAVVTAQKPLYEQTIDRLVVNVKNSVTATGSNALEILTKSPGVRVDGISNEISLDGSRGVVVEINGKRSRMNGDALVQLLQSMPADNIEKIELIGTPPASYDAEGVGGIINIVLVQNLEEGTNGNISLNMAYGARPKFGGAANLNVRKGKWNVFTDVSTNNIFSQEDVTISKAINHEGTLLETETYSSRPAFVAYLNARFGVDYEWNKQTTVGMSVSGFSRRWKLDAQTNTVTNADALLLESSQLRSVEENNWQNWIGNINLRHTFSNHGKLSIDYDYLDYWNENPTDYIDMVSNEVEGTTKRQEFISRKENPIRFHVLKMDYQEAMTDKWKVEFGVKATVSEFMNDNTVADIVDGNLINRPNYTNIISMDENIYAAYMSTDWQFNEKTSAKLGLRYEYTDLNLSNTVETITQRNYGRLFPSAFLSHNFNENNSLQLSYSERIQRPSLNILAPAFFFFSPNALIAGNPEIRASFTQQLRLSYRYKVMMLTLQMSDDDGPMYWGQPTIVPAENLTISKPENMADAKRAALFLSFPLKITKFWESRYELGVAWQQQQPIYEGEILTQSSIYTGMNTNQSFKLAKEWTAEIDGFLYTSMNYGLASQPFKASFNLGLQKKFNNSSLTLNVQDLFDLGTFWEINYARPDLNLVFHQVYQQEGNVVRLTYAYNFGNHQMKKKERSRGASSEEQGRL